MRRPSAPFSDTLGDPSAGRPRRPCATRSSQRCPKSSSLALVPVKRRRNLRINLVSTRLCALETRAVQWEMRWVSKRAFEPCGTLQPSRTCWKETIRNHSSLSEKHMWVRWRTLGFEDWLPPRSRTRFVKAEPLCSREISLSWNTTTKRLETMLVSNQYYRLCRRKFWNFMEALCRLDCATRKDARECSLCMAFFIGG